MLSVTDNSSLYYFVSFAIHQFIQGDQDPKFFLNQVISSKDTSMLFGVSSHHFTVSFTVSLHSFTSQFCFTPHFPKGFPRVSIFQGSFQVARLLARGGLHGGGCGRLMWRPHLAPSVSRGSNKQGMLKAPWGYLSGSR